MKKITTRARHRAGAAALLCVLATAQAQAGPVEDTALAEAEFARGDLVASMALWRKAAELGYAPAQARLGDIMDKSEEDAEAVRWYRQAAAQGNAAGEYGLGQMYAKGEGVPKDQAAALAHTLRAAGLDHVAAVALMMEAYRAGGLGLAADAAEAAKWEARLVLLVPGYRRADAAPAGAQGKKRKAK